MIIFEHLLKECREKYKTYLGNMYSDEINDQLSLIIRNQDLLNKKTGKELISLDKIQEFYNPCEFIGWDIANVVAMIMPDEGGIPNLYKGYWKQIVETKSRSKNQIINQQIITTIETNTKTIPSAYLAEECIWHVISSFEKLYEIKPEWIIIPLYLIGTVETKFPFKYDYFWINCNEKTNIKTIGTLDNKTKVILSGGNMIVAGVKLSRFYIYPAITNDLNYSTLIGWSSEEKEIKEYSIGMIL